jgi:signal transduction histidine kinase
MDPLQRRVDALFSGLYGGPGNPLTLSALGGMGVVDKLVAMLCSVLGIPLTALQIYLALTGDRAGTDAQTIGLVGAVVCAGVVVLCGTGFQRDSPTPSLPVAAAVLLVGVTGLGHVLGVSLRIPGGTLGPMIFFLLLVVATEWRRLWSVVFIAVYAVGVPIIAGYGSPSDAVCAALALGAQGLGFRFTIGAIHRQEDSVEQSAQAARMATVTSHEQSVSILERIHWDNLVHDQVINVLRAASQAEGDGSTWLRAEAQRGLALINSRAHEGTQRGAELSGAETERRLAAIVQGICPSAALEFPQIVPSARFDADTVMAVLSAVGEALRNAVRHAGAQTVTVRGTLTPDLLRVTVEDDGEGFDLRRVSPTAMGIRASIRGRMDRPGCSSSIHSEPGEGTVITLEWRPPAGEGIDG